ncbi:MarR family winged helix-turn-helix transcriptional regulator [Pinisolibacter sp.]|uniref:MarR family winged helix-turn-helix transcriptional regulator n=1 Tax=Pinisolibacter sp. TaxID=2172024 RepID=UPI002FDD2CA9
MIEPQSVADLLTYRLLRLSNTLGLFSSRRYRDQFGVTLPEWRVLSIIAMRGTTSAREISRILATDKGWVGLSVDGLVARGLVARSRDARDGRRMLLELTGEGRALHDAVLAEARLRQQRLLSTLAPETARSLTVALDRLQIEADRMLDELTTDQTNGTAPR